jgi:hypothetical protein
VCVCVCVFLLRLCWYCTGIVNDFGSSSCLMFNVLKFLTHKIHMFG